jgi:beta-glucosidase/6-phospho-beta-glucosidase/beta-galactosidase
MVLHNLIEAHVQAYNKITVLDDIDADGDGFAKKVGFSHLMLAVKPVKPTRLLGASIVDHTEAVKNFAYFINDYFINAVINGEEDLNYLNTLERHNENSRDFIIHNDWKDKVDFIGINYYRRVYVYYSIILALSSARFVGGAVINNLHGYNHHPHSMLNDLGWEIYPEGLYNLLMQIRNQWKKPIFITENGIADKSDRYRAPFIIAHLQQVKRAVDEGANVIGYLHWSLMDNYEWLESYRPEAKFGLFYVDHTITDFNRKITKGAQALKFIIAESISQSKDGLITNSAIAKAVDKFGTFNADGSKVIARNK